MLQWPENVKLYISIAIGYMYYGHHNAKLKKEKLSSSKSENSLLTIGWEICKIQPTTEGIEVLK